MEVGTLFDRCFLFGYYTTTCAAQSNGIRQESAAPPQQAGRPYANKMNRCLMFVHALPCFGLGTFLAVRVLATRNYLLAAAATCEHVRRPRPREHVAYLGAVVPQNRRLGGECGVPGRGEWGSVARRKEHAIGGRKYFLCYVN